MIPQQELDSHIDRTLHALAIADPSAGFSHRLKDHLAQHATPAALTPRAFARPLQAAAAALLLCLFVIPVVHHGHKPIQPTNLPSPLATSLEPQQDASKVTHSQLATERPPSQFAQATHTVPTQTAFKSLASNPSAIHLQLTVRPDTLSSSSSPSSSSSDAQAMADLHTPSHPAPALPPTAQERAVVLMLRRGERHELAQLELGRQEALAQQDRASFSLFFDPPIDPALINQPRSLAEAASTSAH